MAREVLARAEDVREIQTLVSEDNSTSLRMLARLGDQGPDCAHDACDVVVQFNRSLAAAGAEAA